MYENKKKKRIKPIIIVIVILFLLYPFAHKTFYEIQRVVLINNAFKYLESGDKEKFADLFCDSSKEQPTFESDIDDIFSLFDGEITKESWKNIKTEEVYMTNTAIDYGKYTLLCSKNTYNNISTITDNSYDIYIYWYIVNKNEPQLEGIKSFAIKYSGTDKEEYCGVLY